MRQTDRLIEQAEASRGGGVTQLWPALALHVTRSGKASGLQCQGCTRAAGMLRGGGRRGREREGTEWNAKLECEFLSSSDQPITTDDDDDDDDDELKGDT